MVTMYQEGKYLTQNVSKCKAVEMVYNELDQGEIDDETDHDTGDTQPDVRTRSDPHTATPASPAALVPSPCPMRKSNGAQNLLQRYGNFRYHGK